VRHNHLVYGFHSSSGILKNWKTKRFGYWICFLLQVKGRRRLFCRVPYRQLTLLTIICPVTEVRFFLRAQHSRRLAPFTWRRKQCQFSNRSVFFIYLEYRTMNKIQKTSDCVVHHRQNHLERIVSIFSWYEVLSEPLLHWIHTGYDLK
jgi:hypothetical protein